MRIHNPFFASVCLLTFLNLKAEVIEVGNDLSAIMQWFVCVITHSFLIVKAAG